MNEMLTESSLIKLLTNKEHVVQIFEEIIEVNKELNKVENYIVMAEQARKDVENVVKIWQDDKMSHKNLEYFTNEKLFYLIFKSA